MLPHLEAIWAHPGAMLPILGRVILRLCVPYLGPMLGPLEGLCQIILERMFRLCCWRVPNTHEMSCA